MRTVSYMERLKVRTVSYMERLKVRTGQDKLRTVFKSQHMHYCIIQNMKVNSWYNNANKTCNKLKRIWGISKGFFKTPERHNAVLLEDIPCGTILCKVWYHVAAF
ncbi:hypothetical protein OUZ56_021343 [Daphnia magna]|uniref:Uncharacterized protein n=1 Tax=Daphnia magna TaxID=35525 RepID=A0ABQ9ZH45_9CRUS|nr:hypothetical protein OUZ56_021343 [Daphnia magna]